MNDRFELSQVAHSAQEMIEAGDQGEAQLLLTRTLADCTAAGTVIEAVAIAEMTRLLIILDAGLMPFEVLSEHVGRMRRLVEGLESPEIAVACAEAELQQFEWVHADDDVDAVVLVDVLRKANGFAERSLASAHQGVRRAGAEAALTVQMIANGMGQDPSSIAVALESLALALTGETDDRMRYIRIDALLRAARIGIEAGGSPDGPAFLLRTVVDEAARLPSARGLFYSAAIHLADLALAEGATVEQALQEPYAALHQDFHDEADSPSLRGRLLSRILERLPAEERDRSAAAEWSRLIDHYASHPDPAVRNELLYQLRLRGNPVEDATTLDLQILRHADLVFGQDADPDTAEARFLVGGLIVEILGAPEPKTARSAAPRRDPALAVQLSEELEHRFPGLEHEPRMAGHVGRLLLDRALRLSDLGRHHEALTMLSTFRQRFAAAPEAMRHLFAQAAYWTSRFQRETAERAQSQTTVDAIVEEFADDADPDVRVWAANALFSAWREPGLTPAEIDALLKRFDLHFGADSDTRICRLDASRRLFEAVRTHENEETEIAVEQFNELITKYQDFNDSDIDHTVGLARQNLNVISLSRSNTSPPRSESESYYRMLRDRLYAADGLNEAGHTEDAEQEWRSIADAASSSADPNISLIGLAALDLWAGQLTDSGRWEQLLDVARRAMVTGEGLDYRAERTRARAYLRLGIAQGRLGDPRRAIATYEALDTFAAATRDDDVASSRQQAVYNRAVIIDDIGDAHAAIAAYDHVLAVHTNSSDSAARRLRRVKALRNKALLLDNLGHVGEAAGAHSLILDIASRAPDPEVNERARLSAFTLAECFTRIGDHPSAAQTYEWICTNSVLGFTPTDAKRAARELKSLKRQARRVRPLRPWG